MMGLALPERAELLGLTCRQYVDLAKADARIVAPEALATDGGIERLKRWLAAGRPTADRSSLVYVGDSSIERAVRTVVDRLPEPVARHVVNACVVFGAGVTSEGWCTYCPPVWPGPECHVIALTRDDVGLVGHELAHSWLSWPSPGRHSTAQERADHKESEHRYRRGVAELGMQERAIATALRNERQADALGSLWTGVHFDSCGRKRQESLAAEYLAHNNPGEKHESDEDIHCAAVTR